MSKWKNIDKYQKSTDTVDSSNYSSNYKKSELNNSGKLNNSKFNSYSGSDVGGGKYVPPSKRNSDKNYNKYSSFNKNHFNERDKNYSRNRGDYNKRRL